ncbi:MULTISPECIES: peptidoglycan D,D-transpeptidase FtsI family protein [Methylococcus]|uniref:Peptidoglycan D,D-transpeptidase FtsI n=1 Tax=Methylococcus capsulatus TaxID=414 RepID=A0ABZ2F8B0_METCP|nr:MULTISPECIES: penicillin-binding transpeptidase domain-containing protein [Methylococcus]MDF9391291.1 penicillin-binding protein 2 [Methylococcus capsulatus]
MMYITNPQRERDYGARWSLLLIGMMAAMLVLVGRAVNLQVVDRQFLKHQGDLRHMGVVPLPAHRGRILDRNGDLLATSCPVKSIWVNPKEFEATEAQYQALAGLIGDTPEDLKRRLGEAGPNRAFVYLRRRVSPELADQVTALGLSGVYTEEEYRRYYPTGEVTAHVLGFTDIDDKGQEGLELAFDGHLKGIEGVRRIIRDGKRRVIEDVESVRQPVPGKDLSISIDQRLQYLAYRELKKTVQQHRAKAGALVMLDAKTGEVLAMVNQPTFNPNSRSGTVPGATRNRAVTDLFEPGSTMKPFAVACALEMGAFRANAVINTAPGLMHVGSNVVKDVHNYGVLDVAGVLRKSSNVGVTKMALALPADKFWSFYHDLGFGQVLGTGFPGEAQGRMPDRKGLRPFAQATLSFGYGVSASPLHLARAYLALASDGVMPPVSLLRLDRPPEPVRVMSKKTAMTVRNMLEGVVSVDGTAIKASIPGFRVAGKTGTVKKSAGRGGYQSSRYISVFAGMAPASDPRLVTVVMIDEPSGGEYYGGAVAAPAFAAVMEPALRLLNVQPDQDMGQSILSAQKDEVF